MPSSLTRIVVGLSVQAASGLDLKNVIHDLVCKELTNGTAKDKLVATACEKVHDQLKFLPEGACETVAKLLWEHEEVAHCKSTTVKAAQYRRWEGSGDCTGNYSILSTDNMNECTQYLIPTPASIWIEQKNDTAYAAYHCQGVTDCASEKRVFLSEAVVGTCQNFGDYSQMRVWITPTSSDVPLSLLTPIPMAIPGALKNIIHDFICKQLTNSTTKRTRVATACEKVQDKLKFLPEGACETVAKLLWEHEEVAHCKPVISKAAELRRWDSSDCTGDYRVLNSDNMNECTQKLIPAPASIWVEQVNNTAYASYHCQGVTDCATEKRVFLADWIVGTCESFGDYSQMRSWSSPEPALTMHIASPGSSDVPLTPLTMIPAAQRIPDALENIIHDFVCKELTNGSAKDTLVAVTCEKVNDKLKFLPEGACETVAKLLWEHEEVAHCKSTTVKASELRRWEGSDDCTGDYSILSTDNMDECTQYLIPAPASIWVEQKNDTAYASYHCQGVTDCAGEKRVFLSDWIVGTCENFGDYSHMRVWITPKSAPAMQVSGGSSDVLTLIPTTQRIPAAVKNVIHNFVCKELTNSTRKDALVATACQKVHDKLKFLPEGACETVAKVLWEHQEVALCKSVTVKASEHRRWEGTSDCTGDYSVLNSDNMNECTQYLIPAPASIWVEQVNDTAYASYHCQGVTDCAMEKRVFLGDWIVGTCENFGDYSQMRVWIIPESDKVIMV